MVRLLMAILLGGLVAGVLDIVFAFVVYGPLSYGISPMGILQSVAGGWIGREAASNGGMNTALLGLVTHFKLAGIMAAIYVIAATKIQALTRSPILWGFVYGLILYVAMNYVVVPLSAAATGHFAASLGEVMSRLQTAFSEVRGGDSTRAWMLPATIGTHVLLVGIPIALIAKRFAKSENV